MRDSKAKRRFALQNMQLHKMPSPRYNLWKLLVFWHAYKCIKIILFNFMSFLIFPFFPSFNQYLFFFYFLLFVFALSQCHHDRISYTSPEADCFKSPRKWITLYKVFYRIISLLYSAQETSQQRNLSTFALLNLSIKHVSLILSQTSKTLSFISSIPQIYKDKAEIQADVILLPWFPV